MLEIVLGTAAEKQFVAIHNAVRVEYRLAG